MATKEREFRIIISAALGKSGGAVLQDLEKGSARAKAKITADAKASTDAWAKGVDAAAARASKAYGQIQAASAKAAAAQTADAQRAAQAQVRAELAAFDQRVKMAAKEAATKRRLREAENAAILREAEQAAKAEERAAARTERAQQRTAAKAGRDRTSMAKGILGDSFATMGGIARGAAGIAGQFASGAGVRFDLGALVGKDVAMDSLATQISNSAFKEGGKRESVAGLTGLARRTGDENRVDSMQALAGLSAYQGKTGDLDTIKAGLSDLAKLSKASYTDLKDMIDAAGDVGNALGEVGQAFKTPEEKAAAIGRVMRVIAAQGQVGAVEIKDLAVQMAKLSAASTSFEGSGEKNLEMMGALAQFARAKGGAPSATAAATSVAGFVNTLKTPKRQDAFKAHGIDVYSGTETGMLKNPFALMKEALGKEAMNPRAFKELFANVVGAKPAEALATVYRQAESKKKGSGGEAVDKMLADYMKPMSQEKINADYQAAMESKESRAQAFQNRLETIASSLADKVLPELEKLGPKALEVVEAFSKLISFAAQNPGAAITTAIVASIGKAALGTVLAKSLEGMLEKAMAGGVGAGMTGAGKAGAALGVLGVGIASFQITKAAIEVLAADFDKEVNQGVDQRMMVANALSAYEAAKRSGSVEDQRTALADLQRVQPLAQKNLEHGDDFSMASLMEKAFGDKSSADVAKEQAAKMDGLRTDTKQVEAAIRDLSRTLSSGITVKNMPATPPGAPAAGRKGIGG